MPDYPLPSSNPEALGFALKPLEHLDRLIREHIEEGRYPGAQIALARNGQLALSRNYGISKKFEMKTFAFGRGAAPTTGTSEIKPPESVTDDTLFLLFSQTKVLTSSAVWALV